MFQEKIDEITKKHNISTMSNGNKLGTIDDVHFIFITEKHLKKFLENNKGIIKSVYLYSDADGNTILEINPSRKPNFYINNKKRKEIFKRNKQNIKTKKKLKEINFKKTTINGVDVVDGFENEFQEYFHENFYWFEVGGGVRKV